MRRKVLKIPQMLFRPVSSPCSSYTNLFRFCWEQTEQSQMLFKFLLSYSSEECYKQEKRFHASPCNSLNWPHVRDRSNPPLSGLVPRCLTTLQLLLWWNDALCCSSSLSVQTQAAQTKKVMSSVREQRASQTYLSPSPQSYFLAERDTLPFPTYCLKRCFLQRSKNSQVASDIHKLQGKNCLCHKLPALPRLVTEIAKEFPLASMSARSSPLWASLDVILTEVSELWCFAWFQMKAGDIWQLQRVWAFLNWKLKAKPSGTCKHRAASKLSEWTKEPHRAHPREEMLVHSLVLLYLVLSLQLWAELWEADQEVSKDLGFKKILFLCSL